MRINGKKKCIIPNATAFDTRSGFKRTPGGLTRAEWVTEFTSDRISGPEGSIALKNRKQPARAGRRERVTNVLIIVIIWLSGVAEKGSVGSGNGIAPRRRQPPRSHLECERQEVADEKIAPLSRIAAAIGDVTTARKSAIVLSEHTACSRTRIRARTGDGIPEKTEGRGTESPPTRRLCRGTRLALYANGEADARISAENLSLLLATTLREHFASAIN